MAITHAASARELGALAQTTSLNVGVGPAKRSIHVSTGAGRFDVSLTAGVGGPADVSRYPTTTYATP